MQALVVQATADLTVRAFRDIDEFRTDRSSPTFAAGKLRFEAGENIAVELPQKIHASVERTAVLTRDRTGDYQTIDTDLAGNPLGGVPYMDTLRSDTTAADDTMERIGQMRLTARQRLARQAVVRHIIGDDPEAGLYAPGPAGDYWVLDIGTTHTGTGEHDLNEADLEVAAVKFIHDDAGNWFAEAQMGAQVLPGGGGAAFQPGITTGIRQGHTVRLCTPGGAITTDPNPLFIGGGSKSGSALAGADLSAVGAEAGDTVILEASSDATSTTPTIPAGFTAVGVGYGDNNMAGRLAWKRLDAADIASGSWTFTNANTIDFRVYRGLDPVDPIGGLFNDQQIIVPLDNVGTTPALSGLTSELVAFFMQTDDVDSINLFSWLNVIHGHDGETASWDTEGEGRDLSGGSLAAETVSWVEHPLADKWTITAVELLPDAAPTIIVRGLHPDLAGTDTEASRCDHAHHVFRDTGPTVNDDDEHGYPVGTAWIRVNNLATPTSIVARYLLLSNADGAAEWELETGGTAIIVQEGDSTVVAVVTALDFGTGFDVTESPTGEANIALDLSEVAAGGELGGFLNAPTVDGLHAGSTHAAAQAAAEATAAAALAAHADDVSHGTHSESLTDGDSNFIFAAGDIVTVVGVPD